MTDLSALAAWCERQTDWIVETAEALGRLESPSTDKAAVDRCGRELAARLEALGSRVERLHRERAGYYVRAEIGRGDRQVLLLGHFDTVWPIGQLARMPISARGRPPARARRLRHEGGHRARDGCRAGRSSSAAAIRAGGSSCSGRPTRRSAARPLAPRSRKRPGRSDAVLVLEPSLPGGAVKTSRKGCGEFEIVVVGCRGARRNRSRQGRQRHSRDRPADRGRGTPAGSRRGRFGQRRSDLRRLAAERRRRRSARGRGRPRSTDRRCEADRVRARGARAGGPADARRRARWIRSPSARTRARRRAAVRTGPRHRGPAGQDAG